MKKFWILPVTAMMISCGAATEEVPAAAPVEEVAPVEEAAPVVDSIMEEAVPVVDVKVICVPSDFVITILVPVIMFA